MLVLCRRDRAEVVRLRPRERKLLGRSPKADVVLADASVSRFHARLTWTDGQPRPVIEDLHSHNGVWVDGQRVSRRAELRDGVRLGIGELEMTATLVEDSPPAVLDDDDDTGCVRLFSEAGPELHGRARSAAELRCVLLEIEEQRRTGTLLVHGGAQVTFALGRAVDASVGPLRGLDGLRALVARTGEATFEFRLDVAAHECPINVSLRSVLEGDVAPTERMPRTAAPKAAS